MAQFAILTLWQVQFTCPPTPTVAQFAILTLWTIEDGHVIRNILLNQIHYFEENYSIPSRISQISTMRLNNHDCLINWFWLCDKFNSHVSYPYRDMFNSHVFLPLDWPNFRFWLCDKFNPHVLLPLPWPNLRFWLVTSSIHMSSYPYRGPICDSDFVTSSIHMSSYPYRGPICDSDFMNNWRWICNPKYFIKSDSLFWRKLFHTESNQSNIYNATQ